MPRRRPAGESRRLQLVYYGYVAGSAVARAVPERVAYALAEVLGRTSARLSKKRHQVRKNLARITGEDVASPALDRLVVEAYASYARYWLETFRLVREGRHFFLDRFRCLGEKRLDEVAARGKGVVVAVGHLGNWDAGGAWVGARGMRVVTVVEVLKPRRMFDFFARHRRKLGIEIHPAQPGAIEHLRRAVEEGAVVAILADRDLKGRGPEVEFFGERTTFPAGPASVALRTGVPVLVAGIASTVFDDGRRGWIAEISDPIELPAEDGPGAVQQLTQEIARELEKFIARYPQEWHVFQPVWLADRGTQR
ncbi:MAG TPA: phosphatidylinositol mannoside acyltransferase [Actinomycetota bacterium]|jgi:phosphatidylinositol dimannoside acyltransferase|nr:phosphatidylinositol mannoside acyltransferase [Actinomycetota bacterium]